ncbi:MAG: O-antigen ligase family protein [Lachnospiraceae bacterium]|nr:O-antigen ligase family protein [Lachnospiraceae bacterium]
MSNKIKKVQNKKSAAAASGAEILWMVMEYITAALMTAMCVAVSFYAKDGYNQIGNAKFAAYRAVMIGGFSVFLVAGAVFLSVQMNGRRRGQKQDAADCLRRLKEKLSVTDFCVLAYLLFSAVSVACGGFYGDALWGSFGWNMGWMSQLSFVLIYLAVSRFGKYHRVILTAYCGSAFVVFLIAVLHRMLIDPIGFYEGLQGYQMAQFLSTMGQATWYASYLAVALPVGVTVFLFAEQPLWRALGGIYTAAGFASLVTQNSDSAYFALAGFMLVFFLVCVKKRETLNRFAEVCTLFFAVGKAMHFLMQIHPNPDLEYDFITDLILNGTVTWILLGLCLVLCLFLYGRRNRPYQAVRMRWLGRAALLAAAVAVVVTVGLIMLQSRGVLPDRMGDALSEVSYFNWNDAWGNGRGRIWSFAVRVFAGESVLHKLFGVGSDCFSSYVAAVHGEEAYLLWGDKTLTNAHNEWLTALLNTGIFGALSYIGIFVTAVRRYLQKWQQDFLLVGAAASAVSYMAYNFFCYQQVCCTPFVFLMLGMGEYVWREAARKGGV